MQLKNGGMLTISHSQDGMFYIYGKHMPESRVFSMWRTDTHLTLLPETVPQEASGDIFIHESVHQARGNVIEINKVHDKMGHISYQQVRRTMKGLDYDVRGEVKACEACILDKAN